MFSRPKARATIHHQHFVGMLNPLSLLKRKSKKRLCPACGDLEPIHDGHIESPFKAICAAAKHGCSGCSLLRHAIRECMPAAEAVSIVVRRSILRDFVEIAVGFARPGDSKTAVLDLFVSPSAYMQL